MHLIGHCLLRNNPFAFRREFWQFVRQIDLAVDSKIGESYLEGDLEFAAIKFDGTTDSPYVDYVNIA